MAETSQNDLSLLPVDQALEEAYEWNRIVDSVALKDSLTKLPNRRAIMKTLRIEMARHKGIKGNSRKDKKDSPLTVIFMDLDGFKQINEAGGHQFGDSVLRTVAERLREARQTDFVGRYGGDEFVMILPETDEAGALSVGERMLRALDIQSEHDGQHFVTGASLGIVEYEGEQGPEALINKADEVMARAKAISREKRTNGGLMGCIATKGEVREYKREQVKAKSEAVG